MNVWVLVVPVLAGTDFNNIFNWRHHFTFFPLPKRAHADRNLSLSREKTPKNRPVCKMPCRTSLVWELNASSDGLLPLRGVNNRTCPSLQNRRDFLRILGERAQRRGEREAGVTRVVIATGQPGSCRKKSASRWGKVREIYFESGKIRH